VARQLHVPADLFQKILVQSSARNLALP